MPLAQAVHTVAVVKRLLLCHLEAGSRIPKTELVLGFDRTLHASKLYTFPGL
jgi:hypothetical protein